MKNDEQAGYWYIGDINGVDNSEPRSESHHPPKTSQMCPFDSIWPWHLTIRSNEITAASPHRKMKKVGRALRKYTTIAKNGSLNED